MILDLFNVYIVYILILLPHTTEGVTSLFTLLTLKNYLYVILTDLKGLGLKTRIFTLRHITDATNDFNSENKIGEGGFGPVFKVRYGEVLAIKNKYSFLNYLELEVQNKLLHYRDVCQMGP